jgi:hypothetical protein
MTATNAAERWAQAQAEAAKIVAGAHEQYPWTENLFNVLSHVTKVYASRDAAMYKLLTDPAGAPTTYGSKFDVPGIKSIAITKTYEGKELRGDNQLMDTESILKSITIKIAYAKLAFDIENILGGHAVTDSGTTPNQKVAMKVLPTDTINFWKLEAQCVSADSVGGDVHLIAYKCKITGNLDMGMAEEDFQLFGFEASCAPTIGTPLSWIDEVANETQVAIV